MGMPPACSEALFNHLCQGGHLPFSWLARCSAVSQQWRGDLANALPTLRALDFGDYTQRVTGADVLCALTRVSAANLRVLDLKKMRRSDAANMEEVLRVMGASFPDTEILQGNRVSVTVRSQDSRTSTYTMGDTCLLRHLMEAFCVKSGWEMGEIRFLLDGNRVIGKQTPHELDMEDDDEIEVLPVQGGAPSEEQYMANHVVSSIPNSGETVPVDTEISVIFRRSKEPTYHRPSRREITLTAFIDAADPCRVQSPVEESDRYYEGRVPPWTNIVLAPKFHVVIMESADVARVGGSLEYHCERNNGTYYLGDDHSWQRYTKQMPLAGSLAVDEATRSIRFTPSKPLLPAQTYGIVLQHYAVSDYGCFSDVVIPFTTED